jgi:steroid delta-isomerase-like uncharacterized protein
MEPTLADRILAANAELLEKGNAKATGEFFAPDYVAHVTDRDLRGLAWLSGFVTQLRKAFPDLEVEVDVLVREGDRVAWQRTCRATHRASFQGFPATGATTVWRDMVVTRFEDGKIAEEWAISDLAERLLAARR